MSRFTSLSFVSSATFLALISVGCGSGEVAQTTPPANLANSAGPTNTASPTTTASAVSPSTQPAPTDIVSQFLDRVRRGGSDSGAKELMTQKAQQELARIGQEMKPIGTPDAKYQVTRAVPVPGEENTIWVHSVWSEANDLGQTASFQVVWTLKKESVGWRISGMAMEIDPQTAPLEINFEDGDQLAAVLYEESSQPEATIATNPGDAAAVPQTASGGMDPNAPPLPTFSDPGFSSSQLQPGTSTGAPQSATQRIANPAGNPAQSFALPPSFQQ